MELRIADVPITRDQNHMRAACGGGVFGAHEHLAFVFQAIAAHPVAFVIFSGDEKHANRLQPIRIRLLQMIEIFFPRQSRALGIVLKNADGGVDESIALAATTGFGAAAGCGSRSASTPATR